MNDLVAFYRWIKAKIVALYPNTVSFFIDEDAMVDEFNKWNNRGRSIPQNSMFYSWLPAIAFNYDLPLGLNKTQTKEAMKQELKRIYKETTGREIKSLTDLTSKEMTEFVDWVEGWVEHTFGCSVNKLIQEYKSQ